jgi:uncharacterized protein YjbI with pentapeptide repeats
MRNYVVENLKSGKSRYGVDIQGLANAPVYDIDLKNCTFDNVADGNVIANVKGVKLENVKFNGQNLGELKHSSGTKAKS